ncbi:MAG: glycosyltransferase family 4 protein, partial [Planctomycetaceae bacterium]|nr:glycosyltransferase family 4 protein [Planctomycetaceae bacterium]
SCIPWIASIHGWLGETHTRRWQWYEHIEGHLVKNAKAVMVGSRSTQKEVEAFGATNVHVIHHGIVVPESTKWQTEAVKLRSEIGAGPDTSVIGVVTRIHPGKGVRLLVSAIIELLQRGRDVIGVIAGVGPEREDIIRELESAGLTHKVRMPGYVEDANPWMAAMDIVALPTLKDSFPFSVIDAVAMGKPVVTTTVGDLPLAVIDGENGFLVPPGEVQPLAAALERLVQNREMRSQFGKRGRKLIQDQFSPAAMTEKLEAMYLSVLEK